MFNHIHEVFSFHAGQQQQQPPDSETLSLQPVAITMLGKTNQKGYFLYIAYLQTIFVGKQVAHAYVPGARVFASRELSFRRVQESSARSTTCLGANWYGRGSEIWPPTNIDYPVRLADSFPGGRVPQIALDIQEGGEYFDKSDMKATQRRGLRWISFAILTTALVFKGAVGPMDVGCVLIWAFYNFLLVQIANSENGLAPGPPDGHVPHMLRNPLQNQGNRELYQSLDALLNFVVPTLLICLGNLAESNLADQWWRVALGRPVLWWMATQISDDVLASSNTLEVVSFVPLPVQYWVRLSSRLCRWGLLTIAIVVTQWPSLVINSTTNPSTVWTYVLSLLPVIHWVISSLQVFGYWVPVAGMQYMRAHLATTEAETLTIQPTAVHHYTKAHPYLRVED